MQIKNENVMSDDVIGVARVSLAQVRRWQLCSLGCMHVVTLDITAWHAIS